MRTHVTTTGTSGSCGPVDPGGRSPRRVISEPPVNGTTVTTDTTHTTAAGVTSTSTCPSEDTRPKPTCPRTATIVCLSRGPVNHFCRVCTRPTTPFRTRRPIWLKPTRVPAGASRGVVVCVGSFYPINWNVGTVLVAEVFLLVSTVVKMSVSVTPGVVAHSREVITTGRTTPTRKRVVRVVICPGVTHFVGFATDWGPNAPTGGTNRPSPVTVPGPSRTRRAAVTRGPPKVSKRPGVTTAPVFHSTGNPTTDSDTRWGPLGLLLLWLWVYWPFYGWWLGRVSGTSGIVTGFTEVYVRTN